MFGALPVDSFWLKDLSQIFRQEASMWRNSSSRGVENFLDRLFHWDRYPILKRAEKLCSEEFLAIAALILAVCLTSDRAWSRRCAGQNQVSYSPISWNSLP
jgi:hypothetical protein